MESDEFKNEILKSILSSVKEYLEDNELDIEDKIAAINKVTLIATDLGDVRKKIEAQSEPLAIHVAKQILYPHIKSFDWRNQIADFINYFMGIDNIYPNKKEKLRISSLKSALLKNIKTTSEAKRILRLGNKEVKNYYWNKHEKHPKQYPKEPPFLSTKITGEQFLIIWKSFIDCMCSKFSHDNDITKEDTGNCIKNAVNKAGLNINFEIWKQ